MKPTRSYTYAALALGGLSLAPLACLAQGSPGTTVEVVSEMPKTGMTAKFEQGVKDVDAYAQGHGDKTGTSAFEILTGPDAGQIDVLVPFDWNTADQPPSYQTGISRTASKEVDPYTSYVRFGLMDLIPDLGRPAAANAPPMKYYEVIDLVIKPGRMGEFLATVRQLSEAERTKNPQATNPVYIYAERSGGDANAITVAIGHPNLADFVKAGKSTLEVLMGAYGADEGQSIQESLDNSIASEHNYIAQYRPDLSFTPSAQGR